MAHLLHSRCQYGQQKNISSTTLLLWNCRRKTCKKINKQIHDTNHCCLKYRKEAEHKHEAEVDGLDTVVRETFAKSWL